MKRSVLSEKSLVVIMFFIVVVIFSFAQSATKEIEKGVPGINSSTVASPAPADNMEANLKTTALKQGASSVHLR